MISIVMTLFMYMCGALLMGKLNSFLFHTYFERDAFELMFCVTVSDTSFVL
jgi:hypothetical protein